ncbi:MAG: hypothetical protein IRZ21_02635 [Thermoleophilaceae bacterium]|nr:hypothetical protein [Thermoleophilaceae bacterium]
MATLAPEQRRKRELVEGAIRLMAPALDLVLAIGERVSRLVEPEDPEYYPPRAGDIEPPATTRAETRAGD